MYNVAEAELSAELWEMSQVTDKEISYQNFPDLSEISPILVHVKNVIDSFLDEYQPLYEYISEADEQTLQFQIPRGTGSTLLTHLIAHERSAIVITLNYQKEPFENRHKEFFPNDHLIILGCNSFKNISLDHVKSFMEFLHAAEQTRTIIMDAFRAYADNSGVKKLRKDFRLTHKFIMFR